MTLTELRDYCLGKPGAVADFPFDQETLVFKIGGKMFALTNINREDPPQVNLKCDPGLAEDLRQQFPGILPGYHMNKRHWNTLILDGTIPKEKVLWLIDHSFDLVFQGLPAAVRNDL